MVHDDVRAYQLPLCPAFERGCNDVYPEDRGKGLPRDLRRYCEAKRAGDDLGVGGDVAVGNDIEAGGY